jgi:hypothetical protein
LHIPASPTRRTLELFLSLLLLVGALHFGLNVFSTIRFDRERIEIWAFDGQIQVTGFYHYVNRSFFPSSFSFGVPFPVDPQHSWPAAVRLSEVDSSGAFLREIESHRFHGETVFRLWFWPSRERWIRLDYTQGTSVPRARYILLTTRKWGQPLDRGEYILHLGERLRLDSSNYLLTSISTRNPESYFFSRSDFLPSKDWEFRWRVNTLQSVSEKGTP